ncbi:aldehyde dehydrogenase domain-containing protein [Cladochytrium replicatum]|nr:aldehyde dehydrogenase domain-containing protein [Cladochytrium replicatum]
MSKFLNFIDNEFVEPLLGAYIPTFNPAKGEVHAHVPDSTSEDVDLAVAAAKRAFVTWSESTRAYRSDLMRKVADLIEARLEDFAIAESVDQGKPLSLARSIDIPRAIHNFRFFSTYILHLENPTSDLDGVATSFAVRQPVGVAALISPWNLPLYLLTWKIAPAMAYGCTSVCKPSEFTSNTAYLLCSVLRDAGVPKGVVNMVFGVGPKAGNALVVHPDVPLISFTGGTATGEVIYRNAAPFFKKLSLELGGKNANIVFADCDWETTLATSVRSSFLNQGEICLCGSRIFVEESIFDRFVAELSERASKLVVGDPSDPKTDLGALVSKEHMAKVLGYIKLAEDLGGNIHTGGQQVEVKGFEKGYFVRPTIITGLAPTSRVCQEEIFGPVVTVVPFKTEDEVIEYANGVKYGLANSVWTQNLNRAHRVARKIHSGIVWVNCWMVRDLNQPFGGVKASGLGREGGKYSSDFFCDEKSICIAMG